MTHTPGTLKERKQEMYADFADGKSSAVMATKYDAHVSSINYHRKLWENAGRPDPRPPVPAEPQSTESTAAQLQPAAVIADPSAAAQDSTNPPATEDQLKQLAAVLNGQADPPAPPVKLASPTPPLAALAKQPEWDIKPGQVYEGAVYRIEWNFMLVDIIELADMKGRCPRGRVAASETGDSKHDLRGGRIKEGNVVNVKVLTVNYDPVRDKLSLSLSISQAPPHPDMPAAELEQTQVGAHTPPPVQDLTPAPAGGADRGDSTPQAAMGLVSPDTAPAPVAPTAPEQPHAGSLCASCIHRHGPFCPFHSNMYGDSVELGDEYKAAHLVNIKVTYGPRPVTSCSAYTSLDSIKAG